MNDLSFQGFAVTVSLIQLGLELGVILLLLELHGCQPLLQLLPGAFQGFHAAAQLSILGAQTIKSKQTKKREIPKRVREIMNQTNWKVLTHGESD